MATYSCAVCGQVFSGPVVTWIHQDDHLHICLPCAELPIARRVAMMAQRLPQAPLQSRPTIAPGEVTAAVLHALVDMIQERKLAGKDCLAATHKTIAGYLSIRTGLSIEPRDVQTLTLALRDAGILTIGGAGIGAPNTYDTREEKMGVNRFWDQVEAFLTVWTLPGAERLGR